MKHFPFDAGQREDGDIDSGDDEHAEEHGVTDLLGRGEHDVKAFFYGQRPAQLVLALAQLADNVFYNHHRAINNEAEINGAQAH